MNLKPFQEVFKDLKTYAVLHSPEILVGLGIAGMIGACIEIAVITPKACDVMADLKDQRDKENWDKKEMSKNVLKKVAPLYLAPVATVGVSSGLIIEATCESKRRTAALATAYSLSESALKEYQAKVVESIGEKKEQDIRASIAKDKLEQHPITSSEVCITNGGNTLFYDPISNRYFQMSIETFKSVINKLNYRLRYENYISFNDLCYELGMTPYERGDDIGWNLDGGEIEPSWSAQVITEEGLYQGQPCLVLDFYVAPRYDFRSLM